MAGPFDEEEGSSGTWSLKYDNQGNAFWFNSTTRAMEPAPEFNDPTRAVGYKAPSTAGPAKPQGGTTTDELNGLGAKITGGTAVVTNEDGSKDRYVKNPDGTWDYRSTDAGSKTADRPLASSASQAIAGASKAAQDKAKAQGNATSGGPAAPGGTPAAAPSKPSSGNLFGLPNAGPDQITAPQSSGVYAGDLIGQLPGFLTGSNPLGQSAYPIVAGANPTLGQDQGFGFTPIPGTEMAGGGGGLQFGGQLGDVNMGFSQNAGAVLGAAGYQPTGNAAQDQMQALALQKERQKILDNPQTAEIAKNLGTNQYAAAQTVIDKILGASGVNYGSAPTYRDPNTGQLKDSHGMVIMETAQSTRGGTPGVTAPVTLRPNIASTMGTDFDEAGFPVPVDRYQDEYAAQGWQGITTDPTRFHTSETGQPEMVSVQPLNQFSGIDSGSNPVDWQRQRGSSGRSGSPQYSGWQVDAERRAAAAAFKQMWDAKAMGESVYLQGAANSWAQAEAQKAAGMWPEGRGGSEGGGGLRPEPIVRSGGATPQSSFAQLMESMFLNRKSGRRPALKPAGQSMGGGY